MSFEDFNDWDAIFLEQAIRVEEETISKSSRNPTQHQHQPPAVPPPAPVRQNHNRHRNQQQPHLDGAGAAASTSACHSFSPPRELSQSCFADYGFEDFQKLDEESEIDRLKRELGRVSEQLRRLEQECVDLKSDRDKKEEQLKSVVSGSDVRGDRPHSLDNAHVEYEAVVQDYQVSPQFQPASTSIDKAKDNHRTSRVRGRTSERFGCNAKNILEERDNNSFDHQPCDSYGSAKRNVQFDSLSATTDMRRRVLIDSALSTSGERSIQTTVLPEATGHSRSSRAIGVQTDAYEENNHFSTKNNLHSLHDLSNKLLAIWIPTSCQLSGRDLVSKLFVICAADFYALSRCISMKMPSQITLDSLADECMSYMASQYHSVEAAKVSRLFLILTKMSNEMVQLDILFDALLDLCTLKNVVLVHRSVRILHVVLQAVLSLDITSGGRDNVMVECMFPENDNVHSHKDEKLHAAVTGKVTSLLGNGLPSKRYFHVKNPCSEEHKKPGEFKFGSALNWVSLFKALRDIAVGNKEESIQVEAISIMNLILMRSNPFLEREQFGSVSLFESVSQLLQGAGLCVQLQVVHLLFLLLNCPKLLAMFCSGCEGNIESAGSLFNEKNDSSALQGLSGILVGLAECVKCRGYGAQELKLRRRAIIVLAFIASSGKAGFEILLKPQIPKVINFLGLIMQALASEMDAEAAGSAELSETLSERTSLIREELILLNRLISSPIYSSAALGDMTSSRDMTSLTLDVANRLSRTEGRWWRFDTRKKRKMESDIDDLARVFRSRVFTYLGANIY